MITGQQIQPEVLAYFVTGLLVVTIAVKCGRQVIVWMLMKLYDFFILNRGVYS